uniref:DUF1338 domain-containing protein n=1 Tax=Ningiella ruwaisensis TaxID=2364274 RepID=UPI00109FE01E|nr:DUF1338 domain-containing protein [Ningiella ruwaisensis]
MHKDVNSLFDGLWHNYLAITPSAEKIHALIGDKSGESDIVNDHIALRTFNIDKVNIDKLAAHFKAVGYTQGGEYDFAAKKLNALHFQHPDPEQPKVFISELRVDELSEEAQTIIHRMVEQIDPSSVMDDNFLYSGTHWQVSSADYKTLLAESEYAAWMAAWGYRANHFTVSVNHLRNISELSEVNEILKQAGFALNTSGGEIKGGEDVCLAQSSTMADKAEVKFSDKPMVIPSCFYEFAQRYRLPDGNLYQGFVAASADKIFESTNAQ